MLVIVRELLLEVLVAPLVEAEVLAQVEVFQVVLQMGVDLAVPKAVQVSEVQIIPGQWLMRCLKILVAELRSHLYFRLECVVPQTVEVMFVVLVLDSSIEVHSSHLIHLKVLHLSLFSSILA